MGGGESHAYQLDWFSRCEVAGCDWQVRQGGRCADHGGDRGRPQYFSGADGEILSVRFMPAESDPQFDPAA